MTQERVFVMEDPSKPRRQQLNFQSLEYNKESTHIQPTMDQSLASHHPHNPQHHSLHHIDHNPPPRHSAQITLPSIKELMQIPPSPIPQPQPPPSSLQQQRILQQQHQQQQQYFHHHHHNHNNIHTQHKPDSLVSTSRPHLPPLQPSLENPTNINNYPFNRNDNRIDSHLPISQHSQQQHSSHQLHQPLMPSSSSEVPSYYSSHTSYPSHSNNNNYPVNHKVSQIPPPQYSQGGVQHSHYQQPPLPSHQQQRSPQILPQQIQPSQRISHHHHHHHHPPPPPSHHHLQPQHQVQQLSQQQVPQGYHPSHVYNNEVVMERSQHDHQSSATSVATSRVPYNSHHYYPQVYSNNSVPPISASSHVTSSHSRPLNEYSPVRDATSSGPLLNNEQHYHQQHGGISGPGHIQQYPPPPPPQHLQYPQAQQQQQQQQRQQMYMQQHHHQQQQQQQPQLQSQPIPQPLPQVSHLQVLPPNIPRPLTPPQLNAPPQLNLPPQHPQQVQNQFLPENREPSPSHLVPPSHHHSGSNSSVSTRSSSPAPSTPVAPINLPFSPNGVPDKPVEQNVSDKKRGRSKHPRRIVPAGPIPNQQQSIPSSQSIPSNTQNDSLVFVPYSNSPTNNTTPPKPPQASRSRKNSISGGSAPSTSKRGRKAKDSSQNKTIEVNNVVNNTSSASIPTSENNEKNRKREHSWLSSSVDNRNNKRYKKGEEVHDIQDDDIVMDDDTIHNEKVDESKMNNMDIDDNDVNLLLSLKENGITPVNGVVVENTVTANVVTVEKPVVKPVVESIINNNEDIKIKEEHAINENVTPVVESRPVVNNIEIKSEKLSGEELFDQSVTTRVRELSLTPEEKPSSYTQEKKVTPRSPKKSNDIVKLEVSEKNTRVVTNKVQDKRERTKIAPVENDSDSDLAMDDGSDDEIEVDNKNKQPEQNFSIDTNVQWNSDDMETEEEEEEIEISGIGTSSAAKEDEIKQNTVDSSSHTNMVTTTNKQKINENVKETKTTVSTSTNSSNKKLPSPISSCFTTTNNGTLSRKTSASSSISRKGSTSSNGSNKEKDNVIYGSPVEAPIASPIASTSSPPSAKTAPADAGNSTTAITNGNSSNTSNTKSQRPCPPRRRSTMRDDEKLELNAIEWEKNIEIPHSIWEETLRVFEIVKHSKEMKNRQPHRKRNHILASILFILCRQNGLPRTFVEICNAASIRKQEIGTYYRLMLKVFESNGLGGGSNGTVDSAEYLKRWCQNLKLPSHILSAAIHVYRQASELNITTGKCPVSVGAASIWLSINSWNEIRMSNYSHTHPDDAELIKVEHKDVASAAGVVNATLVGCFKNLLKYKDKLLPEGFLKDARDRSPYYMKTNSTDNVNNSNPESDTYGQLSSSLDNVKHYGSPTADNCDNVKSTGEKATIETKIERTPKLIKLEPVMKSQVKIEINPQPLKPIKEVDTTTKMDPFIKKEIKHERTSQVPSVTKPVPEIEPGQEDADDELEEGELREDDDDMMD